MQKIVEIKNLQKNFGKFQALKNVTLDVNAGEVLGYIGPNGSGKSTTIRVLLGIIKKSGGSATIFGKDVWTDAIEIHKKIAYVPGDVYLWPNLTGGEIIDLFLKLHGNADLKNVTNLSRSSNSIQRKRRAVTPKGTVRKSL